MSIPTYCEQDGFSWYRFLRLYLGSGKPSLNPDPYRMIPLLLTLLTATLATEIAVDPVLSGANLNLGVPSARSLCPKHSKVWGPGLNTAFFMPVRYFYIQAVDSEGQNFTVSIGNRFKVG